MNDQQIRQSAAQARTQAAQQGRAVDPTPDARGQVVRTQDEA